MEHVDYLTEQAMVVMVTTFFPRGSLKDIIYKVRIILLTLFTLTF